MYLVYRISELPTPLRKIATMRIWDPCSGLNGTLERILGWKGL